MEEVTEDKKPVRGLPSLEQKKPMLKDLNNFLMCRLCGGYLVEATSIVECLHTCTYLLFYRMSFSFSIDDFIILYTFTESIFITVLQIVVLASYSSFKIVNVVLSAKRV